MLVQRVFRKPSLARMLDRHHNLLKNQMRAITSSQLTVEKTTDKTKFEHRPKKEDLVFGTTLSDHMLMVEWEKEKGWAAPRIVPYQNLSISPAASSLHYGRCYFSEHFCVAKEIL
jgi:hypothetical protein